MTCEEAVKKLYEFLDRELDQKTAEQVSKHLQICRLCCDHLEFEKRMKELIQQSCFKEKAPPLLRNKVLGDLRIYE